MYKISRIYVGNCGVKMSWFDGMMLNLTSIDSGLPTDSIINLENGGGKSVLLSLIFSCFETKKDRFLKHLHDSKNRFSQYFSHDGLPGFIAVEWQQSDGLGESTIVTGQVVSRRNLPGSDEVDRHFFSYVCGPSLNLESIPGPRLNSTVARNMPEVLQWFQSQKTGKGRFFSTKNQADWERHLENERGIDLAILKLQLEFSRAEGGVDSGFLTFKTEFDFLKMFFELTLDEERVQSVRDGIAVTCEKLQRKPEYESRVEGLTKLLSTVSNFREAGDNLAACDEQILALKIEAGRAVCSIEEQHQHILQDFGSVKEAESAAKIEKDKCEQEIYRQTDQLTAYKSLSLHQKIIAARMQIEDAEGRLEKQRSAMQALHAAASLEEIRSKKETLAGLRRQRDEIEKGLADLRQPTIDAGTAYSLALTAQKNKHQSTLDQMEKRAEQVKSEISSSQVSVNDLNLQLGNLNRSEGELTTKLGHYHQERTKLLSEGVLLPDEVGASIAIERLSTALSNNEQTVALAEAKKASAAQKTEELTEHIADLQKSLQLVVKKDDDARRLIAEAEAARSFIQSMAIFEFASEPGQVSELNEALLRHYDDCLQDLNSKTATNAVILAELATEKMSIEKRHLAHPGVDVDRTVEELQKLGVKTARGFAAYLADTVPDATRARQLVVNNPAKYLGVCVQTDADLSRAKQVLQKELELKRPVMVSLVDDRLSPAEYGFVIPAKYDSQFNYHAAARFFEDLTEIQSGHIDFDKQCQEQIAECYQAKHDLQKYLSQFGEGRLEILIEQQKSFYSEKLLLAEQLEVARGSLRANKNMIDAASSEIVKLISLIANLKNQLTRLQYFRETLEVSALDNQNALDRLLIELDEVQDKRLILEAQIRMLGDEQVENRGETEKLHNLIKEFTTHIGAIEYRDEENVAPSNFRGKTLEDLEAAYKRCLNLLKQESSLRLGMIDVQHNEVVDALKNLQKKYDQEFPLLPLDAVEALIASDIATSKRELGSAIAASESEIQKLGELRAGNEALIKQYKVEKSIKDVVKNAESKLTKEELQLRGEDLELKAKVTEDVLTVLHAGQAETANKLDRLTAEKHQLQTADIKVGGLVERAKALEFIMHEQSSDSSEQNTYDVSDIAAVDLQIKTLSAAQKGCQLQWKRYEESATNFYRELGNAAVGEELRQFEREISDQISSADFEQALRSRLPWTESVTERLSTTQDLLASMRADFDASLEEFVALIEIAIRKLLAAATNKKMPDGAPYVGGKTVIKIRQSSVQQSVESKRQNVEYVLDQLIAAGRPPDGGAALIAQAVLAIAAGGLNLQLLKFVVDPIEQYVPIARLSNSGGEAVAMAMFIYFVIAQLRAESKFNHKNATSGPLILDNPFAKATNATLWQAQRALAKAMGAQLIFATALPDYNTLAQFERVLRLRRAGQDKRSERWHIELSDYELLKK